MNLTTCIMYLCCASVVSNLSLLPRKFLILNFYRHENARWTRIIIIITIISGSVHCYTIIYQMCTKHILLHGAYIRHAASCSHPYYIVIVYTIYMYKYFAMCGSKVAVILDRHFLSSDV